jgi:hypothetical protein
MKPSSSTLHALIDSSGQIIKDSERMCDVAVDYYETFFKKSDIIRPHPYTDAPPIEFDNNEEIIPEVTLEELINTIQAKRKKKSLDAQGISNFMFNYLDLSHWSLLVKVFNNSFQNFIFPSVWKETRMILLAKKESICQPSLTRPISLVDSINRVLEMVFVCRHVYCFFLKIFIVLCRTVPRLVRFLSIFVLLSTSYGFSVVLASYVI